MPEVQELAAPVPEAPPQYKLDVQLHELLMKPAARPVPPPPPGGVLQTLPVPPFPSRPKLQEGSDEDYVPKDGRRKYGPAQIAHAMRGWALPYLKSRILPGHLHPIVSYLFTEWKCNLDCHYCWAFDNRVKGMTEDIAKRSIDWLHEGTGRVLALMGGEPLLRPDFAHKVTHYATKKGFWVYIPTNGRLLRPDVIDKLGDAGVGVVNLAIDAVDLKPGLPKALVPIRKNFDYLIKRQFRYGYSVFININICGNNMDDVRELTEIAHDNGVATDYHICESPLTEQEHFKHLDNNPTYITEKHWDQVDELLDWLVAKQQAGYKMTNSTSRISEMKEFMRGGIQEWNCRAGQNTLIIRTDGTLAPCFPMYSAHYDWGTIENHKFEPGPLKEMKKSCQPHCFSTLNHIVGFCYNDARVIKWLFKQAMRGFQGVTNWSDD
jgi:MoaA/NifB/PqqE/SkfB family radical SAM enzyme